MRRKNRIGIALAWDRVVGVVQHGRVVHTAAVPLDTPLPVDGDGPGPEHRAALSAAFVRLREQLEAAAAASLRGATVHISLLPPLAHARLLTLPPLRQAEAEAVVRRDAGRYFVGVPSPRLVGVAAAPAPGAPLLAAAAGAMLVDAMADAVGGTGWRTAHASAAHAAWLEHGRAAMGRHGRAALVALDGSAAHVLQLSDGAAVALRRLPAGAVADIVASAGAVPGRVLVLAQAGAGDELRSSFEHAGWTVQPGREATPVGALEAAARHAGGTGLHFTPASAQVERRLRERRAAVGLAAAAVLLVLAGAGLDYWSAGRSLERSRAERAAIRDQVQPLLTMRDSIAALEAGATQVETIAAAAPAWTDALFDIALLLPPETHLTRLNATGDTLVIEAQGARAGAALQALRGAGSLRDARLLGVVDRELTDGATAVERFRLRARVVRAAPRDGTVGRDS